MPRQVSTRKLNPLAFASSLNSPMNRERLSMAVISDIFVRKSTPSRKPGVIDHVLRRQLPIDAVKAEAGASRGSRACLPDLPSGAGLVCC